MRIVILSVILSCAALGAGSSGVVAPDDACSRVAEYAGFSRPSRGRSHAKDAWNVDQQGVEGGRRLCLVVRGSGRGGYGKDAWSVFFEGVKVDGASASSFEGLGERVRERRLERVLSGKKVKDASASSFGSLGVRLRQRRLGTVFVRGGKVREASASSFECLGGGYGKDAWNVFDMGRKPEGVCPRSGCRAEQIARR